MQPAALKGFRLSQQQARLWSWQQPDEVYRAVCAVQLEGQLDTKMLRQALQDVVSRHAILRTIFHLVPGMERPMQVVATHAEMYCPVISLEDLGEADQEAQLAERYRAMQEEPFDLAQGPLCRTELIRLCVYEHILLLSLSALCADASTLKYFVAELSQAYQLCLRGEAMVEEPLQYVDVTAWQDELLQEEDAEIHREYWRKIDLSGLSTIRLPFERGDKGTCPSLEARGGFAPQRCEIVLEETFQVQVQALTQRIGVSVEAFLLACWQVLLWRLTAQSPSLVGVACDGRHYEELATALGLYTRIVPFVTHLAEDQPFEQVLTQVNASLQEAVEEQIYFTWEASPGTANNDELTFFPVSFEFEDWSTCLANGSVRFCLQRQSSCMEPFALKLNVLQVDEWLRLEMYYDPARFSAKQVKRLADCLHTLLHSAVNQPQALVSALPVLSPSQQQELLQPFTSTLAAIPPETLIQLFEANVERTPKQLAVVAGGEQLSYEQFNRRANQLAHFLQRRGVGPNVLVGLCVERSVHLLVGLLAIWKAGGAYVPLDPQMPVARLAYQLADVQAPVVLTQEHLLSRLPSWPGEAVCLDADASRWAEEPTSNPEGSSRLEDLAYVIYTSGSTGVPKGVQIRQQSVVNYTHSMCGLIAPEPGWHFATVSTLAADLGNTAIFCALASGGCLHVLSYETLTSGQTFADYMAQYPLDVLKIVPSHLSALLSACLQGRAPGLLPRRFLVLGGEALKPSLLSRIRQLGGQCCVINHYGPTETTIGILVNVLGVLSEEMRGESREGVAVEGPTTVPIGRPIANSEAYILDKQQQLVPVGVIGELYLGGVGLAVGYLHQEEETRQRFVVHPFRQEAGARLYKTGDLARYTEEGLIEFVGRGDSQVKLRGYRIELGEIEAILGRHPQVWDCVVVLREDEPEEPRLVAYVVARQQLAPTSQELCDFVGENLPAYMVPSTYVLVNELPLTANGKVDRSRLPMPELSASEVQSVPVEPRSPIEEILVDIWGEVLTTKQVGIHDNFFSLGGHSLLATQVIARIHQVLQVDLPILSLFEAPTIAKLAECVERVLRGEQEMEVPPLIRVSREQDLLLSFAQQRLWFLDQLEPGRASYSKPIAVQLRGRLEVKALADSLREIVQRHEVLRTTFSSRGGWPVQVIGPTRKFLLPLAELSGLPPEACEIEVLRLAQQEAQRPFDLASGPLLRTTLLRLGEDEHALLLNMHHIASDAWSNGIFLHELTVLYNAFVAGQPSPLPELPLQYADFAAWQRRWLQGEVLKAQMRYWIEQLSGVTPLELPTDRPRPAVQSQHGAHQRALLPAALREELKQLSQREGVTLFMTLLAAFQVLLARYTGQSDISVGTVITNRRYAELEGLIGFFINTLVLRTDLSGNPSFQEALGRVREVALSVYAHQEVPFEKLVEVLQPERDLSRSPLFQVAFGLQHAPRSLQKLHGLTVSGLSNEGTTAKFDLSLMITDSERGLHCDVEYNTDLFEAGTITRLLDHFHTLLAGIVTQPERHLASLPLLSEAERQQMLVDWNDTQTQYSTELCLHTLFERQVAYAPDAIALVFEQELLTYAELNARANQVAALLHSIGVAPGTLVGLCMERSLEGVIALLGLLKAGGVYVPLDPAYPAERLAFILKEAQISVLLTQEQLRKQFSEREVQVLCLDSQCRHFAQQPTHNRESDVTPEHLAYVIYTSGSTGTPKGVMVPHRAICNRLLWGLSDVGLTGRDWVLQVASWSFDIALWECVGPLMVGAQVVLASQEGSKDSAYLVRLLIQQQITIAHFVPSLLQVLLTEPALAECKNLRCVLCGGEAVTAELVRRLHARLQIPLHEFYGPTEAAISATVWACAGACSLSRVPIGRPIANMQIFLLDDYLMPVPPGVLGEIYIGGVGLAWGYLHRAEMSAERFLPHPFSQEPGARLYRTGDVARYLPTGELEFIGRRDSQVKIRGYRIELGEIEAVLVQHPQVRESLVVMREDASGDKWLVAYTVARESSANPSASELRQYVQEHLPDYMVPSFFVQLESVPLTPNGKVDRRALPDPGGKEEVRSEDVVVARSPIEEVLAIIWAEVLGRPMVGIHDNFFELGGHSLLATRLVARLRTMMQVDLPLQSMFEAPTVAELAKKVEQALHSKQGMDIPPLVAVAREQDLPLSFAQQRLWFLDQLEPGSSTYNISNAVRLSGKLDTKALEQSMQELVRRHESLRTTFHMREDQPVQVIRPVGRFLLPIVDLSVLLDQQSVAVVRQLAQQEAGRPFNLVYGPLLRMILVRLDEDEHVLLVSMHHIISDGWSMGVFVRELTTLYNAFIAGQPSPLPELPLQYADFAVWQRRWLQGEVLEAQMRYWTQQLGEAAPLELPTDYPRPAVQTFRGTRQGVLLSATFSEELKQMSQREGVTLFMTLLAAFQVLLARYSGQSDISVGTPIANRHRSEVEGLIGFFVNTLVLRGDLSSNPSFQELLGRLREVCLGAYAHQDVPFEKLVEVLQPERDLSRSPLFQVMLILQNVPRPTEDLANITLNPLEHEDTTAKFDLTLAITDTGQGLYCGVEYNTDLFEAGTIGRLLDHWQTLLAGIVAHPEQNLSQLPFMTKIEQSQVLVDWNDTATAYPKNECIHQLFEEQVKCTPDAVAVLFEDEQITYSDLNDRANQLGHHLRTLGVGPDVLVGICMKRSMDMLVGLLAILKAGGAYVPLDPTYPPDRLAFMVTDAQVKVLLSQRELLPDLPLLQAPVICLDTDWATWAREPRTNSSGQTHPKNLAYVIYTSGSTGRPKGVAIEHHSAVTFLYWAKETFTQQELSGLLASTSICFDLSVFELFVPLSWGGRVILAENALQLPTLLARQEVTLINTVPSAMATLIRVDAIPPSVQSVNLAGEALQSKLVQQIYQQETIQQVFNLYGPSEDTTYSTYAVLKKGIPGLPPIGRPISNTQIYLLDEHLQPVPIGIAGEVYIGGMGLARGYLNRPGLTAETFLPHPFSTEPGARLYRTGDLARYLPDGNICYTGRIDYQVKVRGYRIEVGEIEAALEKHSGVRECVVVVREDEVGDKRLVAYVVTREPSAPAISELRQYVQRTLPDYMVPAVFLLMEALPLTPNGKVDRRALPEPDTSGAERSEDVNTVRTPVEEMVAALWSEVLGRKQVSISENFFELGGHSLLAMQLIARVRSVLQVEVPLRSLFEAPTVAALAERVEQALYSKQGVEIPPLAPVSREQELPLSFAQQRLWFLDQLEPGSTVYNIPVAVRFSGRLNVEALEWSLQELVRRHESLRTTFHSPDGQPVQVIELIRSFCLPLVELNALVPVQREAEAQRLTVQEAKRPFDLAAGPLLRAALVRLNEDEHVLLLSMHHIVSDAWSMEILVRELSTLYTAFVAGKPSPLPELPLQYADFAAWQRQWLQGEVLEAEMSYWTEQLSGVTPLELPTDHPRPPVQTFQGATQGILVPAALSEDLKQLSQREGVTLFMTLLAAFQVLLARYSGQSDISVGTPTANRTHTELEGLIGFFVNTLVLRSDLSGNPSFREVLARVRDVALTAYAHQDAPFERLVEVLQPERDLSRSPLFQVVFNLQHAPRSTQKLQDLTLSSAPSATTTAKFDLTLAVTDTEQGLRCTMTYNSSLFEGSTISRLLKHWLSLLAGIIAHPDQSLAELPLLSEAEHQQLLFDWNETRVDYPVNSCIHELFEAQVERTPDVVAVIFEDEQLTYAELNRRANQLAHYLCASGVKSEQPVGLCVDRSLELVIGLMGILKAGGAYVPLDPTYPKERLAFLLQDAHVSLLLTQERLVEQMPTEVCTVLCLDKDWHGIAKEQEENLVSVTHPKDAAYVIYTSGSTGTPKGVVVEHRQILNYTFVIRERAALAPGTTFAMLQPLTVDSCLTMLFPALLTGSHLQVISRERAIDPQALAHYFGRYPADYLKIAPSHLAALLAAVAPENILPRERLIIGGEASQWKWVQHLRTLLPAGAVYNHYGPTEATVGVLTYQVESSADTGNGGLTPIGRPLANAQVYVLDPQLHVVPLGVAGELYLGGAGVARGYLGRADLTAERFVPHPFSTEPGARLYKTGDIVRYCQDGNLEFIGRSDDQVKVRGYRIELGEIEAALGQHPGVREVIVQAREDAVGSKHLVAYVVLQEGPGLTSGEMQNFLRTKLPEYMVPSTLVCLEKLPLTPHGKVDRRALPTPQMSEAEGADSVVTPLSPIEEVLVGLWSEVLGRRPLSISENFFEVGGHSLLATQLISRVRSVLQVELPLRSLFEAPTVAGLAGRIEQTLRSEQGVEAPPLVPVSREQELPLSFAQQRLWFLDQLEPGTGAFNIPHAVRLSGKLDVKVLEQSMQEIVRRHEGLRTTFCTREGRPVQVIEPVGRFRLPLAELSGLSLKVREAEARQLANEEAQRPFNLVHGPLLRIALLRLGEEEHVLLLTMHHIVSDGWSMDVLVRELNTLYLAFVAGKPSPLPALPIQYADFALWQHQWLQGGVLAKQIAYWQQQLAGGLTPLNLPTDRPRPPVQTSRGANVPVHLPAPLMEELRTLSRREGVTLFMALLAAFQTLLFRYSGQEDIVVGTDVANRNWREIEGLIGFFVNQLVLRTDLSGNPTFRELLQRVRNMALRAYTYQDLPFEKLVEVLKPERSLQYAPLFQVKIIFQALSQVSDAPQELHGRAMGLEASSAKLDLILLLRETPLGLAGSFNYNTDLFDASTIKRLADHFKVILEEIVAKPDIRLNAVDVLTKEEKEQRIMEQNKRQLSNFGKFKSVKPKPISLQQEDLITLSSLQPGEPLPLLIQPNGAELDLVEWTRSSLPFIETKLLKHGAILFRGFKVSSPLEFERFASTICSDLLSENGEHPREEVSRNVYTPVFYPSEKKLLWHNENSFNASWPMKIWFFCARPAEQGGETPIVDSRKVFQHIDSSIRDQFMQKNVMYVRNYGNGLGLNWQTVFRTASKQEVEDYCRRAAIEFEWKDGDCLRTRQVRPAIAKHPQTGERVWWNQATHWHPACLEQSVRDSLFELFREEDLPRHCYYGDGSPIEDAVMAAICEAYQEAEISFPWQQGDVLMLDNMLTAHARNPFQGPRKIYVSMGNMISIEDI
jgi:amino acid adenylation domain-containing protein